MFWVYLFIVCFVWDLIYSIIIFPLMQYNNSKGKVSNAPQKGNDYREKPYISQREHFPVDSNQASKPQSVRNGNQTEKTKQTVDSKVVSAPKLKYEKTKEQLLSEISDSDELSKEEMETFVTADKHLKEQQRLSMESQRGFEQIYGSAPDQDYLDDYMDEIMDELLAHCNGFFYDV